MAITITVNPSAKQAAYRPIIFEATSNRNNSLAYAVTGVTSGTGAKARYAMASHTFLVGDIITGSGFTGTAVVYNVAQTVTVVAAGYVETDLAYSVVSAGSPFLTRTNANFKLKGSIYTFDQTKLTVTGVNDNPGTGIYLLCNAPSDLALGDFVLVQGTTNYNGSWKVLGYVVGVQIVVAATYVSNQTGTVRKGTFIGSGRQNAISVSGVLTFRFNIANFLQSALAPDLASSITDVYTPAANSMKWYSLFLTEEFDDVDGTVRTTYAVGASDTDSKLSAEKLVLRASLKHTDTQTLDAFITPGTTKRFLTNSPRTQKIRVGEEVQLSFLPNTVETLRIAYEQYNLGGTSLGIAYTTGAAIVDGKGIAPVNSNVFSAAVSRVDVWLDNSGPSQVSEKIIFLIDKNSYQNPVRFLFENYLGGFDAFTFTGSYKRINISERTSYKRDLGTSFVVSDRGDITLGVRAQTGFEVWSRFLTRAEGVWLEELMNNPNVFIQEGSNRIPITILNTNDPTDDTAGPLQLKIQYKHANDPIPLSN